jgi:transcriptional regulator with XRE-family HTH domain
MTVSLYDSGYEELRRLMKSVRFQSGLTQTELATMLGITQSQVSKFERAQTFVDVLFFYRWCQACGVEPGATLSLLNSKKKKRGTKG